MFVEGGETMYHELKILIRKNDPLFPYVDDVSAKSKNLYNATLFRLRQVMTGIKKDEKSRTENEQSVLDEIAACLPHMPARFSMPTPEKNMLSYNFLDWVMKLSNNPDYNCPGLPKHCAQHIMKHAVNNMTSFYQGLKQYYKDSSKFKAKPKLPKYIKSDHISFYFTNQECVIHEYKHNPDKRYLKLPLTKLTLDIPDCVSRNWLLKEVQVKPFHDVYYIHIILDDTEPVPQVKEAQPSRICAIDVGVNNFAAITNNVGLPCLLFKGRVLKNANHTYDKAYAYIEKETAGNRRKFKATDESKRLCVNRENYINDFMHKTSKIIIKWCVDNNIDTLVLGKNKYWKQENHIGRKGTNEEKKNTQNFQQIPFFRFAQMLQYHCERNGIRYVEQEESYTSKASYIDKDDIPVFSPDNTEKYSFSGYRRSRGEYKLKGRKITINADLNGSANIGRKAFPEQFVCTTLTDSCVYIYKHPDLPYYIAS